MGHFPPLLLLLRLERRRRARRLKRLAWQFLGYLAVTLGYDE
jgi:hypothetical protein